MSALVEIKDKIYGRDSRTDMIKGFAIIAVVMFHAGFPYFNLYPFHNTIFFVVSGYLFADRYSKNVEGIRRFILRKVRTLYLPYVAFNGACLLLNNAFCKIGIYIDDSAQYAEVAERAGVFYEIHHMISITDGLRQFALVCLFMGATEPGSATWFLRVLFFTGIMFVVFEYAIRKVAAGLKIVNYEYIELLIGIPISIAGRFLSSYAREHQGTTFMMIDFFHLVFMAWELMALGRLLRKTLSKYSAAENHDIKKNMIMLSLTVIIFIALKIFSEGLLYYEYGIVLSAVSFIILYSLAGIISVNKSMENILSRVGKNSMYIMMGHLLAFKAGNYIVSRIENLPDYFTGAFMNIDSVRYWWLYSIVGVIIPFCFAEGCKSIKKIVGGKISAN